MSRSDCRWTAAVKNSGAGLCLLLAACASAPVPKCIPPDLTPEASGPFGAVVPRTDNSKEEYARCKQKESDERLEAQLRKDEAEAKKREAEQLERELREMQEQGQEPAD